MAILPAAPASFFAGNQHDYAQIYHVLRVPDDPDAVHGGYPAYAPEVFDAAIAAGLVDDSPAGYAAFAYADNTPSAQGHAQIYALIQEWAAGQNVSVHPTKQYGTNDGHGHVRNIQGPFGYWITADEDASLAVALNGLELDDPKYEDTFNYWLIHGYGPPAAAPAPGAGGGGGGGSSSGGGGSGAPTPANEHRHRNRGSPDDLETSDAQVTVGFGVSEIIVVVILFVVWKFVRGQGWI